MLLVDWEPEESCFRRGIISALLWPQRQLQQREDRKPRVVVIC